MNVKRVTRLIALLQRLQSGQSADADGLAEACGVSKRTFFRDVESLREAGVPIEFDANRRHYRIEGAHFLPPTNLTLEEALSLVLVAERSAEAEQGSIAATAGQAAAKITAGLPAAMQEEIDEASDAVVFHNSPTNPLTDKSDVYRTLLQATVQRQRVAIDYDCLTEFQDFRTEIDPYNLLFHERSWYVVGRSARHNEVRTFNVGRVREATLLEERFKRPDSFSLKKHFGNAWRMIPDEGPDQTVHLRFSRLVGRNVSEVLWHPTQRCEFAEDGSLDYFATVSGLSEIMWWVLGYGDQVEVVKPDRLRQMVGRRLAAAARRYA